MAALRTTLGFGTAALLAAGLLTACGGNDGGNTKCSDFNSMSTSDQQSAVEKMIKDKGLSGPENNVTLTLESARLYCTVHSGDSTISGIYSGS